MARSTGERDEALVSLELLNMLDLAIEGCAGKTNKSVQFSSKVVYGVHQKNGFDTKDMGRRPGHFERLGRG